MLIVDLLLLLLAIGIVVFFVTQVAIPFYQGTPFFPWVRHTPAHEEIVEIREELAETEEEIQAKENKMKTEDATAAVLTHDLARYAPIRVVYKIDPETGDIHGLTEESFSMNSSPECVRVWWSGKAYSILGEHFINGVEDAEQYVKDGYVSVDPLTDECLIEVDWAAWKAATSKYSKRNAPFKTKNKP